MGRNDRHGLAIRIDNVGDMRSWGMSPGDTSPSLASLLRAHRTGRGLSQEELAARSGTSVRLISNLERSVGGTPRPGTLAALADALGLAGTDRQAFLMGDRPADPPAGRLGFGTLLRTVRERAGLTQEELAARALVSARTISDLERGVNRAPRHDTAVLMADTLGLRGAERDEFDAAVASAAEFVRLRSGRSGRATGPGQLPVTLTRLVGRAAELRDLRSQLLIPHAVVTLTGTGGVGKTRLAVELAQQLQDGDPSRVVYAALASTRTTLEVVELVALAAGTELDETILLEPEFEDAAVRAIAATLSAGPLACVLDNIEQVDGVGALVARLRDQTSCPLLVTSRSALGIDGEGVVPLQPLGLPATDTDHDAPAVTLFLDRARAAVPRWRPDTGELADVAGLCRLLDGLPLALVLAAPAVRTRSVRAIAAGLAASGEVSGPAGRDVPYRHRSLHAALAWSYSLLDEPARILLRRLSIFRGSVDVETAELVCGAGLSMPHAVSTLVAANLVMAGADAAGEQQLRMLNTVAQFAAGQLAESAEAVQLSRRLADAMLQVAETAAPQLVGPDQAFWQAQLTRRVDAIRTAHDWLLESGELALAARLAAALWRFWYLSGQLREGRERVSAVLSAIAADAGHDALAAEIRYGLGVLVYMLGDVDGARDLWVHSCAAFGEAGAYDGVANSLNNLGMTYLYAGDLTTARSQYEAALAAAERSEKPRQVAVTLLNLAKLQVEEGDGRAALDAAARWWTRSLAGFEQLNDPTGIAPVLVSLAELAVDSGPTDIAAERLERALALAETADDPWTTAHASVVLAQLAIADAEVDRARALLDRADVLSARCDHVEVQARVARLRATLAST
jgi:predicted ATPase/DNA-binding XRE family transcriptional regulator